MANINELVRLEQARQFGRFIEGVPVDQYLQKIESQAEFLIHKISGECAGFVAFYCNKPEVGVSYISLLLTAQEFRGQKVASALLEGVFSLARARGFSECQLEVRCDNQAAIAFYTKFGFSFVGADGERRKMARLL